MTIMTITITGRTRTNTRTRTRAATRTILVTYAGEHDNNKNNNYFTSSGPDLLEVHTVFIKFKTGGREWSFKNNHTPF
jgi:hypothetical protein